MVLKFIMLWIGGVVLVILGLLVLCCLGCLVAIVYRKVIRKLCDKYEKKSGRNSTLKN